jgi:hypothetical protein
VTFTAREADVVRRAQQDGVNEFKLAFDAVIARYRDRYDADDKAQILNLFGSADAETRQAVLDLLRAP